MFLQYIVVSISCLPLHVLLDLSSHKHKNPEKPGASELVELLSFPDFRPVESMTVVNMADGLVLLL